MQQLHHAVALHNQGRLHEAEEIYREVLAIDGDNFYALNFCGCIQRENKKFEEGIVLLSRAVSLQPSNPDALYNLGNVFKDAERWEEAIFYYEKVIALKHDYSEALNNLGVCLGAVHRYDHAEIILRRAVLVQPSFAGAWLNLGNILKDQENLEDAIISYESSLKAKPDFSDAYLALGSALKEQGKNEEAIAIFNAAIKIVPDCAEAYYQVFLIKGFLGDVEAALSALKTCLDIDPSHYNARQSIGFAFIKAGKSGDAIKYFMSRIDEFDFVYWAHLFRVLDSSLSQKLLDGIDIKSKLIESILAKLGVLSIEAFGDSHVNVFRDVNGVFVNYVGASTAYNLSSQKSSSGGGRLLQAKLSRLNPQLNAVMLCFGEIDCRAHIVKQAYIHRKSIQSAAEDTAAAYFEFIQSIKVKGFQVVVCAPYGSGSQFNSFGAEESRNYAVKYFNNCLQKKCFDSSVFFCSLDNLLIDPATLMTRRSWLTDDVHLPELGHQGDQVKVLLLSRLLIDIQSRQQKIGRQSLKPYNNYIHNVCIFGMNRDTKSSYVYARIMESGLVKWRSCVDNSIDTLCFDLGTNLALKRALFSFESITLSESSLEFKVDGVESEVIQFNNTSSGIVICDFINQCVGRFVIVSGFKSLSDIRSINFLPVPLA